MKGFFRMINIKDLVSSTERMNEYLIFELVRVGFYKFLGEVCVEEPSFSSFQIFEFWRFFHFIRDFGLERRVRVQWNVQPRFDAW